MREKRTHLNICPALKQADITYQQRLLAHRQQRLAICQRNRILKPLPTKALRIAPDRQDRPIPGHQHTHRPRDNQIFEPSSFIAGFLILR